VPGWKQYTRVAGGFIATDDQSPPKLGPAAAFVTHIVESIGSLVKQYAGAASKMKVAGADTIHSVECYVIETKSQKPLKRLWIDRARHVLVQEETTTKGGGLLRTSFSDMSVNQPLPDSLFVFAPEDGAVLVDAMTPPGQP
jgi:outer membrane lipoprotein-sorting protein